MDVSRRTSRDTLTRHESTILLQNDKAERGLRQPFRLLDLPSELRNIIYNAIVTKFANKSWRHGIVRHTRQVRGVFSQLSNQLINLLLTCKTVWRELLALLFDAFIWVVDMRYNYDSTRPLIIEPSNSWVVQQSTFTRPLSMNIRHVRFNFEYNIPYRIYADPFPDLSGRRLRWTMDVQLDNRPPFHHLELTCSIVDDYYPKEDPKDKRNNLRKALQRSADEGLTEIHNHNMISGHGTRLLTVEEWKSLVSRLEGAFRSWLEQDVWAGTKR